MLTRRRSRRLTRRQSILAIRLQLFSTARVAQLPSLPWRCSTNNLATSHHNHLFFMERLRRADDASFLYVPQPVQLKQWTERYWDGSSTARKVRARGCTLAFLLHGREDFLEHRTRCSLDNPSKKGATAALRVRTAHTTVSSRCLQLAFASHVANVRLQGT